MTDLAEQFKRHQKAVETARHELNELAKAGKAGERFDDWLDNLSQHCGKLGEISYRLRTE